MYKKILLGILASASLLLADIRISVVGSGRNADPFWNVVKNGIANAQKDTGSKVDYRNPPSGSLTEMARLIDSSIAKRPDGLVVSVPDVDALAKPIKKAIKLGIPVITFNSGKDFSKKVGALMYVGQENYTAGFKAGEKLKKAGVKSFVCINHEITNFTLEQRCKGFADALGVKNNMIDVGIDPSTVEKKVRPKLDSVDTILTLGPVTITPTINAIKKAKLNKHLHFVAFDLSEDIVKGIKNGVIDFAIDQQPYLQGYIPIIVLTQYIKYGVLPSGNIDAGPGFVTKENISLVEKYAGKYR